MSCVAELNTTNQKRLAVIRKKSGMGMVKAIPAKAGALKELHGNYPPTFGLKVGR